MLKKAKKIKVPDKSTLCLNVSDWFGSKKLKSDSLIRYKGNLLKYSADLLGTLIF